MELTTDLVVRSRQASITMGTTTAERRNPTPADWQRWKSVIAARYKSEPARMIIQEMTAAQLLVTEKMFRDRLRLWGMNDKNQRKAPINSRGFERHAGNKGIVPNQRKARYQMMGSDLLIRLSIDARIHDTLSTPKEFQSWQRALRSVFDWQQSLQDSAVEVDEDLIRDDADTFNQLLVDMHEAVIVVSTSPWFCKSATRSLAEASAAIDSHLKSTSIRNTPLSVLRAIMPLQYLAYHRDSWWDTASEFLLRTTAETLPACHPTLLLMKALLLNGSVSEALVILYELGFGIIQRSHGESSAAVFQCRLISGALFIDPDAAIGSHAELLCAAAGTSNDATQLLELAEISRLKGRFSETAHFAQRCLARLQDLGEQNSPDAVIAWWQLSCSQREQRNIIGEEESLLNALAVVLAADGYTNHGTELSIDALQYISMLYRFYERNQFEEKREALRAEYSSAFEL